MTNRSYDILVIGGGHAGIEAAVAPAKMGCSVGLLTMDKNALGRMSCNPAIGGTAKGHLVREIDALGGLMGRIADETGIQFRMLNKSKGPAVWSPRCQSDRTLYSEVAGKYVFGQKNLEIIEDSVVEILIENGSVKGIRYWNRRRNKLQGSGLICRHFYECNNAYRIDRYKWWSLW